MRLCRRSLSDPSEDYMMIERMGKLALWAACLVLAGLGQAKAAPAGETFDGKCASCHGKDGKGKAAMAKIVNDGLGKMPAYKGKLTDADVAVIVKHLRSLAK